MEILENSAGWGEFVAAVWRSVRVSRPVGGPPCWMSGAQTEITESDGVKYSQPSEWLSLIHISEPTRPY